MLRTVLQTIMFSCIWIVTVHAQSGMNQRSNTYSIVDTGIEEFYSNTSVIKKPEKGEPFFGQDAHYRINPPSYTDNEDGTITDNVTGLMWQKVMDKKMSLQEALLVVKNSKVGGYQDWRLPSIYKY